MEILFTFKLKQQQEEKLARDYPALTFYFNGAVDDKEVGLVDVIVTYGHDITSSVLEHAKSLKWIMVASAGVEKLPLADIAKRKILMTNVKGIHKTPMAESVLAHILALRRAIPEIYELQKTKEWRNKIHSTELKGATALILGPGVIGSEIGRLLQAFGVRTIGCNRSGLKNDVIKEVIKFDKLIDKLPEADFVISVLPSTSETRRLLTGAHFEAMKSSAVFMNFGRGDLVEEKILVQALRDNVIRHAVLDVFETEPLPVENELWTLSNCTVSPHISSKSGKYIERSLEIFNENLKEWFKGEGNFINIVDPVRGY